ncbi:MAG: PDZ domain-containing protein [Candidatus Zixiibacteriota bacterium]|nr:MAG: PDZ domain-containing protein [candidate division Zixibacteria bacterium]
MSSKSGVQVLLRATILALGLVSAALWQSSYSQNFDFEKLGQAIKGYTVVIDMKLEISFGVHVNEQEDRLLGTIVSSDGLVLFDGASLATDNSSSSFAGFSIRTKPTNIEVTTLDGRSFTGEYVGVDRYTKIGFLRIEGVGPDEFVPITFTTTQKFNTGRWLALFMLLPEFVSPPLAVDVGMISTIVESPEYFPLTVGFSSLQIASVLFNEALQPVGVLGQLEDPAVSGIDPGGMMNSFERFGMPLLGVVTGDRLSELIADPPEKGKIDRGWLGITLQALTEDIADFWGLETSSGIIVNDVVKGSPAEQAGLEIGDIVYEVNGQPVEVDKDEKIPVFQRFIADLGPGTAVEFSILRVSDDRVDTLRVLATLEAAPLAAADAPEYESEALEFKVRDLVFADYLFYNQDPETFHGVVVSELKQGGLAALEGLAIGDVIQKVGDVAVETIDDIKPIMDEVQETKPAEVIFFVWRNNKTLFVNVKTHWN